MSIEDPVMAKIRARFKSSKMTMNDLGILMGYPPDSARKSVSQFLKGGDPRISTIRKFAKATGASLPKLIS
jgi:transcriptional regulator with XRE-family HTH domain